MIDALLFLQWHSLKNHVRARVRRLRQPKYLIGGLVGGLYFSFVLLGQFLNVRRVSGRGLIGGSPETILLYEMMGALMLLVVVLSAWIFPHKRAALTFTEAEIAFLFPAPVTRRTLIHFKLLRSQAAILFTTLIFTLVFSRRRPGALWIPAAGWWIMLSTLNLHRLGSSFARTMLLDRGITNWQRRLAVLGLMGGTAIGVGVWAWWALPPLSPEVLTNLSALGDYARQAVTSGPLPYLLYPLRLVVKPYLAVDAATFAMAVWPALLLLVLHYAWVVRSDVAFEEASIEASRKLAEKVAGTRRDGGAAGATTVKKPIRAPFTLRPTGPPSTALLWKNLIGVSRLLTARFVIVMLVIAVALVAPVVGIGRGSGLVAALGFASVALCAYGTFFGLQIVRQDFRADLALADVLKQYPLGGWQLALGEVLAPALIVSVAQWGLILVAVICLAQAPSGHASGELLVALGFSAALLLPILNVIALAIVNAAALLFPAWMHSARSGPRGVEVMGQQMLLALGQFVVLFIALLPAAALFGGILFVAKLLGVGAVGVPIAALAATFVLALEAGLGVMLLGRLFERLDLSVEQTS